MAYLPFIIACYMPSEKVSLPESESLRHLAGHRYTAPVQVYLLQILILEMKEITGIIYGEAPRFSYTVCHEFDACILHHLSPVFPGIFLCHFIGYILLHDYLI